MQISGRFEVSLNPQEPYALSQDGINLGRMALDKTYFGELQATSRGEMLSAMTSQKGSAGYVAIELVSGTLMGKQGSFVLQHFGVMNRGAERLILEVLADSGTGELVGLSGSMTIQRQQGQHQYTFEFHLSG